MTRWMRLLAIAAAPFLPLSASAQSAPTDAPLSLEGVWKFRTGDDLAWALPDYDDRQWTDVSVPTGWGPVAYEGPVSHLAWYRKKVDLAGRDRSRLAVAMGPVDSAYELFAGGHLIGRVGSMPPQPVEDYDRRALMPIPADLVAPDGTLVLAVRVWTPAAGSNTGGLYEGPVQIGPVDVLVRQLRLRELPVLVISTAFAVLGLTQLALRWRGREHAWFGVMSIALAVYALLQSQLKYEVFDSFVAAKKLEHLLLYFLALCVPEFLWPLLGLPLRREHRIYQLANLLLGLTVVFAPSLSMALWLLPVYEIGFNVFIWYAAVVVARAVRAGHPEALTLAAGMFPFALATIHDTLLDWGLMVGPRLVSVGFVSMAAAMAVTLGRRFRRTHRELVALQQELETRVAQRTAALEERSRELAVANEAKTRFLASVSHEIRTPLNGILGINRMLLRSPLEGRQRELGEIVQAQGRSLLAIINDILDYSKMETGHFGLDPADFSLRELVTEIGKVHATQAEAKGVAFETHVAASLPDAVHGDPARLRQILDNLLANAVKFTDEGRVQLRVMRDGDASPDVRLRFEIEDTGVGLDPATVDALFQPFTQADAATTRRYGGTGLGLAIAKSLVEMMGGQIGGHGFPGKGATFWFTLRLGPSGAVPKAAIGAVAAQPPMPTAYAGARVLVAEDNPVNRIVTVGLLEEAGCRVDTAANGLEAVDAFTRGAYDLVLMDCRMPEMDGYTAASEIRRLETAGRRTPIVALTAHAVAGEAERCRAAGMDDCVAKPAGPDVIAGLLNRWLQVAPDAPLVSDSQAATDHSTLDALARKSPRLYRTLLTQYLEHVPGDLRELRAAADRGEVARVRTLAHRLSGSAQFVGAIGLARLLREVEAAPRDAADAPVDLAPWMERVEREQDAVLARVGARMASLTQP